MLTLAELGVRMVPAMPAFYQRPNSIDDLVQGLVDRLLDQLGLTDAREQRWGA